MISRPAGQIPNSKRFMIHWRRHDEQKGNLRGLRRRKMNGWSKKTSATLVCLCKELPSYPDLQPTIRSPQHHMTSCYFLARSRPSITAHHYLCFTVLQNFQKIFASSSFIWESLPRNAFWEIWARDVHLAFLEFSQDVFIFMFFFEAGCNLARQKLLCRFFHRELDGAKGPNLWSEKDLSRAYPLSLNQLGALVLSKFSRQLRPCWASIGACYPWSVTLAPRTKASQISCFNSLRWIQPFGEKWFLIFWGAVEMNSQFLRKFGLIVVFMIVDC